MNPNDLADLPETLRTRIENTQASGYQIADIERIRNEFITVYMYDYNIFILIQYIDNNINTIYTSGESIKKLYDDWWELKCGIKEESSK